MDEIQNFRKPPLILQPYCYSHWQAYKVKPTLSIPWYDTHIRPIFTHAGLTSYRIGVCEFVQKAGTV